MLFKFFAKQGQENQVVVLLKKFGNPRIDKKPEGVLVSVDLPDGVSKRSVNKMLFQNHVVGSQSKKNRFRVLRISRWDKWTMADKIGYNKPFILRDNEGFKKVKLMNVEHCSCCGPFQELVDLAGRRF